MSATDLLHEAMPFTALLGIERVSTAADEVRARIEWQPGRCTSGGLLHGGLLMALADSVGAMVTFLNLPQGAAGTTTIVVDTELRDADDNLVARVTQTQAVLQP